MSGDNSQKMSFAIRSVSRLAGSKMAYTLVFIISLLLAGLLTIIWYHTFSYVVLLNGIDANRLALVAADLQHNNIAYQYDPSSGNILVPESDLAYARLALALQQQANGSMSGVTKPDDNSTASLSIGETNHLSAHYSLESELAKTIASIDNVLSARVHLSLSEVQNSKDSKASVVVRMASGRKLTKTQIDSISRLVASSTKNLSRDNIIVIDQSGQLLKSAGDPVSQSQASAEFEFTRRIEQSYVERIENILTPILGIDALRVQVTADVDFDLKVRENLLNESASKDAVLSNSQFSGSVRKLSIALVIDDKIKANSDGRIIRIKRNRKEIKDLTELTKKAVGFDSKRGDSVNVLNESFNTTWDKLNVNSKSTWSQEQVFDAVVIIGVLILISVAVVLVARKITNRLPGLKPLFSTDDNLVVDEHDGGSESSSELDSSADNKKYSASRVAEGKYSYEQLLAKARDLAYQDPEQVAKLLRTWVREDGK